MISREKNGELLGYGRMGRWRDRVGEKDGEMEG